MNSSETRTEGERRPLAGWVGAVISLAVLGVFVWYLLANRDALLAHFRFRPGILAALAVSHLLVLLATAHANRLLFRCYGVGASTGEWFGVVVVGTAANYLPFSMGLFAKGYLLKRLHGLEYRRFAAAQLVLYLLFLSCSGAVGLVVLLVHARTSAVPWFLPLLLAGMTAPLLLVLLPEAVPSRLRLVPEEMRGPLRRRIPPIYLHQVLILGLRAANLFLCFRMGDRSVPYLACLFLVASAVLTRLFALTPGALGVREFFIGALAGLTGYRFRDAVLSATIDRVVRMLLLLACGLGFSRRLGRRVAEEAGRR